MTDTLNIIGDIHACSDSKGLCRVLETHFTNTMKEHLLTVLKNIKAMLMKSKQKTKDKKVFVPEYLENVDFVLHFLQLMGKIPAMLRTDQIDLDRITGANQRLDQIIADKDSAILVKQQEQLLMQAKLNKMENELNDTKANLDGMEIDCKRLTDQLQQYKTENNELLVQAKLKEKELLDRKAHLDGMERDCKRLSNQLQQNKNRAQNLEKAKEKLKKENNELLVQAKLKEKELHDTKEDLVAMEKDCTRLSDKLQQYKNRIQILERSKETLDKEKNELEKNLWEMEERLGNKHHEENTSTTGESQPRDETHCKVIKKIHTESDIVSKFKTLTAYGPWLNAKVLLDEVLPDGVGEINKLQVLCDVIMIPWQAAKEHINKGAGQNTEMSIDEITKDALEAHFACENKLFLNPWSMLKKSYRVIQEYVDQATCIAVAMVEHKPQLDFRLSEGKYLGENIQELQWGSVDPKKERYNVHDVYPNIYNGETMLEKGKVLLVGIKELHEADSAGSI